MAEYNAFTLKGTPTYALEWTSRRLDMKYRIAVDVIRQRLKECGLLNRILVEACPSTNRNLNILYVMVAAGGEGSHPTSDELFASVEQVVAEMETLVGRAKELQEALSWEEEPSNG